MKKIVVGYDASPAADRALARTAELATSTHSEVVVASIAPILHARGLGPYDPADSPELHRAELRSAKEKLRELGVDAVTIEAAGDPAKRLVDVAEREHADMLVVGATRHPRARALLGAAVSESVAHKAHTDVLIVH